MRWFTKTNLAGLLLIANVHNANAVCAIQICVPQASCAIGQNLIKLVGDELFKKLYFDPIINNSSGIFYRAGTSRLLNMAKNEKVKSRSIEATARLEAERYFYYKKAAFATKVLNGIKRTQADAELLSREATAIRSEMLLFLLADKSNQKISEKKKELLGN